MKVNFLAAGLAGLAAISSAQAVQIDIQTGGALQGDGIRYLNFNEGALGDSGVDVVLQGNASAVKEFGNYYAPPSLANVSSDGFGPSPTFGSSPNVAAPEWTKTRYLQTSHALFPKPGGSRIIFDFKESQTYFGLLWGSIDPFNNIAFYLAGQQVQILNGKQIVSDAKGSQLADGTFYVNFTDFKFDEVVLWSDNYSFEFDNVAYGQIASNGVPDGGMTAALLGLSMSGMALIRRKVKH